MEDLWDRFDGFAISSAPFITAFLKSSNSIPAEIKNLINIVTAFGITKSKTQYGLHLTGSDSRIKKNPLEFKWWERFQIAAESLDSLDEIYNVLKKSRQKQVIVSLQHDG